MNRLLCRFRTAVRNAGKGVAGAHDVRGDIGAARINSIVSKTPDERMRESVERVGRAMSKAFADAARVRR